MKLNSFAAALTLAIATTATAADKHSHGEHAKPMHGGVVVEVKDVDYELVAKPDLLRLYIRDHGKPVDISKVTAKLTLLSSTDKQEVELQPAGDRLEAKGTFKVSSGTQAIAQVKLAGKPGTARFVLK